MSFLSLGISLSIRSNLGPFAHYLPSCAAIAPFSTTIICHTARADLYRYRYHTDPEFRKAEKLRSREWASNQGQKWVRERSIRCRPADMRRHALLYKKSSAYRRICSLARFIRYHDKSGALGKNWSWRSHAPVIYNTRVEHHCTACDRERYLALWWKEKISTSTTDESRYMCNACFASDSERIMPEKHPAKLPGFFTDTDDKRDDS